MVWSVRELQLLLGYAKWDKFTNVINKAKNACVNAGEVVENHFPQVEKKVLLVSRGIYPEQLPAGEDVKKVERRLRTEEKKITVKKKI